jgi:hypothetical protein
MFAKRLGEKLKSQGIRVFSVDPGGMESSNISFNEVADFDISAVVTGLQKHISAEFTARIEEWRASGGTCGSLLSWLNCCSH